MSKDRDAYYRFLVKNYNGCLDIEEMDAKDILGFHKYLEKRKKKDKVSNYFFISCGIFYLLMILTKVFLTIFYTEPLFISILFLLSSITFLISLIIYRRFRVSDSLVALYKFEFERLPQSKKLDVELYKKSLERSKSIDSILDS